MYPQFIRDSRYHRNQGEASAISNKNPNYVTPATFEDDYIYGKADEAYSKNVNDFDRELSKLGFKSIFDVQTPAWTTERDAITDKNGKTTSIQGRNEQMVSGSGMEHEVKGELANQDINMVISAIRAIRQGNTVLAETILGREVTPADMQSAHSFPSLRPTAESAYGETIRGFYPSEGLAMKRYIRSLKADGIDYTTREDATSGLTYVVSDVSSAIGNAVGSVVSPSSSSSPAPAPSLSSELAKARSMLRAGKNGLSVKDTLTSLLGVDDAKYDSGVSKKIQAMTKGDAETFLDNFGAVYKASDKREKLTDMVNAIYKEDTKTVEAIQRIEQLLSDSSSSSSSSSSSTPPSTPSKNVMGASGLKRGKGLKKVKYSNLSNFKPIMPKGMASTKLKSLYNIYEGEISGGNSSSEAKGNLRSILNEMYDRKMIAPKTYNDSLYKNVSKKMK